MELSPTAYVILGFTRFVPRSGYEIKTKVEDTTRFFWTTSYGQIYPELHRLSEAGLIEGTDSSQGGRKSTAYSTTPAGEQALEEWLRRPPEVLEMRDEGLLKLFFAGAGEPEDAIAVLTEMRDQRLKAIERLREIEPMPIEAGATFPLLVLHGGIELHEHIAGWCERSIERIRKGLDLRPMTTEMKGRT